MLGKKFDQVENPFEIGKLDASKCYILVFYKEGKTAIVLWRGSNQTEFDFRKSVAIFLSTKFRLDLNNRRLKHQARKTAM